ncbi:MAG TPA: hypothetical protein HA300_00490 [Thermococcaceae archaeon]|nr:hypothetical protein [Thermococcaceae archaeon]
MGASPSWLEEIVANYKILVDTSALMRQNSDKFFIDTLLPLLKKYNNKLILPWVVVEELKRHKSKHPEKAPLAIQGLHILSVYKQEGVLDPRGEKTDYMPDQVFQTVMTKFKMYYNLAFITNDRDLARDLCMEYNARSVGTRKSMVVISVRRDGTAFKMAENGKMFERFHPLRPKNWGTQKLEFDEEDLAHVDNTPLNVSQIPREGDTVSTSSGRQYVLLKELAQGGEGTIYLTNDEKMVAKIYHPNKITLDVYKKIKVLVKNRDKINFSTPEFTIAWPQDVVYNSKGEFVGYIMPKVKGEPLQSTVFLPMVLKKKYPHFRRVQLVRIAINALKALDYLHSLEILMGDINAMNILVDETCHVSLIDVDSYQVGPFKCKVGRPEFTHPEKMGMRYDEYFREPKDEMFGIAILVFMILLPGKHPFAHQGGEGIIQNIQQRAFSYRISTAEDTSYENAPVGHWRFIWSHTPLHIKEILYQILTGQVEPKSFEELRKLTWKLINELEKYEHEIENGNRSNEIFPRYYYIPDNIPKVRLRCPKCGHYFEITQEYYDAIKHKDEILCPYCFKIHQIRRTYSKTLSSIHYSQPTLNKQVSSTKSGKKKMYSPAHKPKPITRAKKSKPPTTANVDISFSTVAIIGIALLFLFLMIISPALALLLVVLVAITLFLVALSQR